MRAHPAPRAASAALTVALSASLALGAAGSALAASAAAPSAATQPRTAHAAQAQATRARAAQAQLRTTTEQFRVLEDLGRLTVLTGRLGRLAQDEKADVRALRELRGRIRAQLERLALTVDQARPRTLPIVDPGPSQRADTQQPEHRALRAPRARTYAEARQHFEAAVDKAIEVATARGAASDAKARAAASDALVRALAAVDDAALAESGFRLRDDDTAAHTLPAPEPGFSRALFDDRALEDTGDALAPVARLIEAVRKAPDGVLDRRRIAEHDKDLAESFAPLQHKTGGDARRDGALAELRRHAEALLEAERSTRGAPARIGDAARELTDSAAVYVRAAVVR